MLWLGINSFPLCHKFKITLFPIGCRPCCISQWSTGILSDESEMFHILFLISETNSLIIFHYFVSYYFGNISLSIVRILLKYLPFSVFKRPI